MHLDVNGSKSYDEPSVDQIRTAVGALRNDEYAILSREDEDYVQAYRVGENDYQVEYRAGSDDEHYECTTNELTSVQIQDTFVGFAGGSSDWHSGLMWRKMDI